MGATHFGNPKKRLEAFRKQKLETLAIHGGQYPEASTGALMPPIYQTSTYAQKSPGNPMGEFEYSRTHNPTRRMLEDCLALLEGGSYGLCTSSGMSAMEMVLALLDQGDEIICADDVYGGTYRLLTTVYPKRGIKTHFVDLTKIELIEKVKSKKTRILWIETPTNPLLKIIDIKACAELCKKNKWLLVVDNTFASPIFQKPLELGADVVVHSMTKYLNGHSDVVGGAVVTQSDNLADRLYKNQNSIGLVCPPFDSWLVLRALKTLPIRMKAHEANAFELARWLENHKKVEKVLYPGLPSHPQHKLAKKQMKGFSGMLSFYVKGGLKEARRVLERVKIFTLAESLGGVESLIEHPGIMTHASVPLEIREKNGIGDNFIRLSVGLESIDDIKADLDAALK